MHLLKKHKHLQNKCEIRNAKFAEMKLHGLHGSNICQLNRNEVEHSVSAAHSNLATSLLELLYNIIYKILAYIQVKCVKIVGLSL